MIAAVVPAAGKSSRMGRPKLTLPIAGGGTVIERVIDALKIGGAESIVVVVPPMYEPGTVDLVRCVINASAVPVPLAESTADMRSTVEVGLGFLEASPHEPETLLLAPGDSVGLTPGLVDAVLARSGALPDSIVIPVHDGRRGHPIALPWEIACSIRSLPPGVGINAIRDRFADRVVLLDVFEAGTALDLDTPDDYLPWAPSP